MASLNEYLSAIGAATKNMLTDAGKASGIYKNVDAQNLVTAYQKYVTEKNGAADTKDIQHWIEEEQSGKDALAAIADDAKRDAAKKSAIDYVNNSNEVVAIKGSIFKDGKAIFEEGSNWFTSNWPMLAAIAAPVLGMFMFGMEPLMTGIIALGGLGIAAAFSEKDSILGGAFSWLKKATGNFFGLMSPDAPAPSVTIAAEKAREDKVAKAAPDLGNLLALKDVKFEMPDEINKNKAGQFEIAIKSGSETRTYAGTMKVEDPNKALLTITAGKDKEGKEVKFATQETVSVVLKDGKIDTEALKTNSAFKTAMMKVERDNGAGVDTQLTRVMDLPRGTTLGKPITPADAIPQSNGMTLTS